MCCTVACLGPKALQLLGQGGKRGRETRLSRERVQGERTNASSVWTAEIAWLCAPGPYWTGHCQLRQSISAAMTTSGG
jgi:hypothetical protein